MSAHPDHPDGSQDRHGRPAPLDEDTATDEQTVLVADIRRSNVEWAERSGFAATDSAGRLIGPSNALEMPAPSIPGDGPEGQPGS